jgi:Putative metallopeptidase
MAGIRHFYFSIIVCILIAMSCGGNANNAKQKHGLNRLNQVKQTINPAMQLTFLEPANEDYMDIYEIIRKQKPLTALLDDITERLNFKEAIQVYFDECDESNAFYDPETREITFCYQLLYDMVALQDDTVCKHGFKNLKGYLVYFAS